MDADRDVAHYLAEWYLPELTEQSVDDIVAKLDLAAANVSDERTPVRLLVTLAVPTDEVLYGVFGADSPEIVTATCERAGFPINACRAMSARGYGTGRRRWRRKRVPAPPPSPNPPAAEGWRLVIRYEGRWSLRLPSRWLAAC